MIEVVIFMCVQVLASIVLKRILHISFETSETRLVTTVWALVLRFLNYLRHPSFLLVFVVPVEHFVVECLLNHGFAFLWNQIHIICKLFLLIIGCILYVIWVFDFVMVQYVQLLRLTHLFRLFAYVFFNILIFHFVFIGAFIVFLKNFFCILLLSGFLVVWIVFGETLGTACVQKV